MLALSIINCFLLSKLILILKNMQELTLKQRMGPDPFRYLQTFPSNPQRTKNLLSFISKHVQKDKVPTLGYAVLLGRDQHIIQQSSFTIGCGSTCDLKLEGKGVDELHCTIDIDDGLFELSVSGRTGMLIDGIYYPQGSLVDLGSNTEIQIQDFIAKFMLPSLTNENE